MSPLGQKIIFLEYGPVPPMGVHVSPASSVPPLLACPPGPGFINIRLSKEFLADRLTK